MALNKRKAKKLVGLLNDGIAIETVIMMFVEMAEDGAEASKFICENFDIGREGVLLNDNTSR